MVGELVLAIGMLSAPQAQPCRISGFVIDPVSRAGIGQASVLLKPSGRTVAADESGRFAFPELQFGRYAVAVAVPGFAVSRDTQVDLSAEHCAVAIEIEYRLAMTTEARAEKPPPALAPIAGPLRTTLDSTTITTSPGGLEDVFRALQGRPGVAASQDDRNDLLVRGGGAIENQTRVDGFDVPNPNHFGAQGGTGGGLSIIPPWLIHDASIEAGGFSVAFGERSSSAVNLSLRSGRADRIHASAGASPGGAMALAEGPLPGRLGSWLVSGRRSFPGAGLHARKGSRRADLRRRARQARRRAGRGAQPLAARRRRPGRDRRRFRVRRDRQDRRRSEGRPGRFPPRQSLAAWHDIDLRRERRDERDGRAVLAGRQDRRPGYRP